MKEPILLDGKQLAREIEQDLIYRIHLLREASGIQPTLATILVGDDPASATYVNMKARACERVGMASVSIRLDASITTVDLIAQINALNADPEVHGILLQHPVPPHIDERACFDQIQLEKDVDGVSSAGFGKMAMGEFAFGSATPSGIMRLLDHYKIALEGKHAVVVGRSPILGKPMSMMLLNAHASVSICHSRTQDLPEILSRADLVVGACGIPNYIQADWLREGVVLIDAGYHPGRVGDIDLTHAAVLSSAYTPVPGGVGPMTIATVLSQTVVAASRLQAATPIPTI